MDEMKSQVINTTYQIDAEFCLTKSRWSAQWFYGGIDHKTDYIFREWGDAIHYIINQILRSEGIVWADATTVEENGYSYETQINTETGKYRHRKKIGFGFSNWMSGRPNTSNNRPPHASDADAASG